MLRAKIKKEVKNLLMEDDTPPDKMKATLDALVDEEVKRWDAKEEAKAKRDHELALRKLEI